MNVSRFEFLENGDILVVDEGGQTMLKKHESTFKSWGVSHNSFNERVKRLYDAYISLRNCVNCVEDDSAPREPRSFLLYDFEDANVIEADVHESDVEEMVRKYAEEVSDGFQTGFTVGAYALIDRYQISKSVLVKKI